MNANLSPKAAVFMGQNPTVIGVVGPVTYYEHPTYGDEAPMFFIEDGKLRRSEHWDIDSAQDAQWNLVGA
jgi:hypothetical protein